jgi:uncharacterized protein YkwD
VTGAVVPAVLAQRPGQPRVSISRLENRVHDLVNAERSENKLKALEWDKKLSAIARMHSEDMARRDFFSHVNPDGEAPTARGVREGYSCRKVVGRYVTEGLAENISQGNLYSRILITGNQKSYDWNTVEEIARQAVEGWMKSSGHRQNILGKGYDKSGIGAAIAADDKVYITQLFC